MVSPNASIIERLQNVTGLSGLTQKKLSKISGISATTISRWKRDDAPIADPKSIKAIADAIGCNYQWLATGKGEPFPSSTRTNTKQKIVTGDNTIHGNGEITNVGKNLRIDNNRRNVSPEIQVLINMINRFDDPEAVAMRLVFQLTQELNEK